MTRFTNLALRYPKDRLPVLAGIAERWADGLEDTYVSVLALSWLSLDITLAAIATSQAIGLRLIHHYAGGRSVAIFFTSSSALVRP